MLRGTTIFRCDKCGKTFKGLDLEYCCTVFSCPMPCPDCGVLCAPFGANRLYRKIGIINNET